MFELVIMTAYLFAALLVLAGLLAAFDWWDDRRRAKARKPHEPEQYCEGRR